MDASRSVGAGAGAVVVQVDQQGHPGICDTDDKAYRVPVVWALRSALTDPDTEPAAVRHSALAMALRHTTRTFDGDVQRWQLLRHPPPGRR